MKNYRNYLFKKWNSHLEYMIHQKVYRSHTNCLNILDPSEMYIDILKLMSIYQIKKITSQKQTNDISTNKIVSETNKKTQE